MINIDKVCEVCGSNKGVCNYLKKGHYYCGKHRYQLKKFGEIQKRTSRDANEIIEYENYAEILLYDIHSKEVGRAIIDKDKIDLVKNIKWYLHSGNYVCYRSNGVMLYLHRFLINAPKDKFVDHINMNKLDNRIQNLRLCTNAENMRNRYEQENNYSGFRGVSWNKDVRKWSAHVNVDKQKIILGYFDLFNDAVDSRLKGERKYFKEFAPKEI